jgi:hypothetical protein
LDSYNSIAQQSAFGVRTWKLSTFAKVTHPMGYQNYLELHRTSESTLSCWQLARLHLQSFQRGLTSARPVVKIVAESLSEHDEKHVVPTPLSGIRVGKRKDLIVIANLLCCWNHKISISAYVRYLVNKVKK